MAILIAQDGGIRGDEGGEFGGEIAGFDAVAGGFGFSGFGFGGPWDLAPFSRAILAFSSLDIIFLLFRCVKRKKALVYGEGLFPEVCLRARRFNWFCYSRRKGENELWDFESSWMLLQMREI